MRTVKTVLSMKPLRPFLLSVFVLCGSVPAFAASVLAISLELLSAGSELIFEGEVVNVQSTLDTDQVGIHTYVTFRVNDVIKGEYLEQEIVLRFLGGTVGDFSLEVADSTLPAVEEKGIYFVESLSRFQVNPFYGMDQGHLLILDRPDGQRIMMTRGHEIVAGLLPTQGDSRASLSNGVARGLSVNKGSDSQSGVSAFQFKQHVRKYMAPQ